LTPPLFTNKQTETDMLERMEKARDCRRAAWAGLGQGGWFPSIMGYLFNSISLGLAFAAVAVSIVVTARSFEIFEMLNIDVDLLRSFRVKEALEGIEWNNIEDVQTLSNLCMWISSVALLLLPLMYMFSIVKYGLAAMAMAAMRRGARFGHAVSGYGRGWSTTWLMALAGMYQFFWTLLFIVPGIRAFYSYRLIYFLRIDRPELPAHKLITESKRLMDGRRWKLFCLDVSFIGWFLLAGISRHLLDCVVYPYHATACAAFYEDLLNRDEAGAFGAEFGADE
jgi:uncharacterized membrane protein